MSWFAMTGGRMTEWSPTAFGDSALWRLTEPLQPGDPDEAEEGAPEPVPDPPDTDPIPEEESMVRGLIEDADRDRALVAEWDVTLPPLEEENP